MANDNIDVPVTPGVDIPSKEDGTCGIEYRMRFLIRRPDTMRWYQGGSVEFANIIGQEWVNIRIPEGYGNNSHNMYQIGWNSNTVTNPTAPLCEFTPNEDNKLMKYLVYVTSPQSSLAPTFLVPRNGKYVITQNNFIDYIGTYGTPTIYIEYTYKSEAEGVILRPTFCRGFLRNSGEVIYDELSPLIDGMPYADKTSYINIPISQSITGYNSNIELEANEIDGKKFIGWYYGTVHAPELTSINRISNDIYALLRTKLIPKISGNLYIWAVYENETDIIPFSDRKIRIIKAF